jgi:hypothetical protein
MDDSLKQFRESTASDVFLTEDFVHWDEVDSTLERLRPTLKTLDELVKTGSAERDQALSEAMLREPMLSSVLMRLLVISPPVGFMDGSELHSNGPQDATEAQRYARIFRELGAWRVLKGPSAADLLRLALVAEQASKRRDRVVTRWDQRVRDVVASAIGRLNVAGSNVVTELGKATSLPDSAKRKVQWVLGVEDRPRIAIISDFETSTGGRQQRDLLGNIALQKDLSLYGVSLVVIADGRGMKAMPDHVLQSIFKGVADFMTLRQAEEGRLERVLYELATNREARLPNRAPLSKIVENLLQEREVVRAEDLPASPNDARLALADYVATHPALALTMTGGGESIGWTRGQAVQMSATIRRTFTAEGAIQAAASLLGQSEPVVVNPGPNNAFKYAVFSIEADKVLPEQLFIAASYYRPTFELLKSIASRALSAAPGSRLALLITNQPVAGAELASLRRQQAHLPVGVVVFQLADIVQLAQGSAPPRDGIVAAATEQADLATINPFVLRSVTPQRMFYGREEEQAILAGTLASNSIALLGGRRIGKTSLMLHAVEELKKAGFTTFFADLQTVRTWQDFAEVASRKWDVQLDASFRPHHLLDLVKQLRRKATPTAEMVVVMLDEVDQLLQWDLGHEDESVPEAFFRACRTVSQEGSAQFVFSGERTIARRLWDAQSPHWNFCRPLALQQLPRSASARLLIDPLSQLGVAVSDEEQIIDDLWTRTSGHPQIVQFIGDALVRSLSDAPQRLDTGIAASDLVSVTETDQYVEHYLQTYWGQATNLERLLSLHIASMPDRMTEPSHLDSLLEKVAVPAAEISDALRMLELYGVITRSGDGITLRATWFPSALASYGGVERQIAEISERVP